MEDKTIKEIAIKIEAAIAEVRKYHEETRLMEVNFPFLPMAIDADRFKEITVSEASRRFAEVFAKRVFIGESDFKVTWWQVNGRYEYFPAIDWEKVEGQLSDYIFHRLIQESERSLEKKHAYDVAWSAEITTEMYDSKALMAFAEHLADEVLNRNLHPPVIMHIYVTYLPDTKRRYLVDFHPPA